MQLKIGNRYRVEHGTGILKGREIEDPDNKGEVIQVYDSLEGKSSDRYIFSLDPGHTWVQSFDASNYCTWARYISETGADHE